QCGLFALSSGDGDVKALEERARRNDSKAGLALDIFALAIRKSIGAYLALLGGADLLVFTGGIGEHSERIRSAATQGLDRLGLTPEKIQVVPTEEEKQIARHCREMMSEERSSAIKNLS
ncbi:MAG TPA: acetate kinase, partial [Candidatus Sulfotelmatobacter sp.]|nr:acetate kinase [Candidatus Sulfotelmatobacter sp.]